MEKYFVSGKPTHPALPHIGLYNPVFDCFVITVDNEQLACQLKSVLSSRFGLYPMYLHTAVDYWTRNINNANCISWTAIGTKYINLLREFLVTSTPCCHQLVPAEEKHFDLINIVEEHHWAMFCLYWLTKIQRFKFNKPHYTQTDNNINYFLELSNLNYCVDLYQEEEKQILKLLYFSRDFAQAEREIEILGRVFQ